MSEDFEGTKLEGKVLPALSGLVAAIVSCALCAKQFIGGAIRLGRTYWDVRLYPFTYSYVVSNKTLSFTVKVWLHYELAEKIRTVVDFHPARQDLLHRLLAKFANDTDVPPEKLKNFNELYKFENLLFEKREKDTKLVMGKPERPTPGMLVVALMRKSR